jgi:hypothetical protein
LDRKWEAVFFPWSERKGYFCSVKGEESFKKVHEAVLAGLKGVFTI